MTQSGHGLIDGRRDNWLSRPTKSSRPKGDLGDYKQIFHTHSEVMQVLSDFDAAELKSRA